MRIKITTRLIGGGWFMRQYLHGRTCDVLAIHPDGSYFVLHPITKKPGYWLPFNHCKIIIDKPQPPTWDAFLKCNEYGYSKF